ncbi:glycosyl transferase group 1, partial [filamentous cyanobacterium CCP5]
SQAFVIPLGVTAPPPIPDSVAWQRVKTMGIPDHCVRVLFLSRLAPKKGLDRLIEALTTLHQDGLEFHLILAGGNPQDEAYEKTVSDRIGQSPLADCTTFTGFVTGEDKAALLQTANLFVLPSDYENFGIAVAEAMLAGLPVVVSRGVYIWPEIETSQSGWVCERSVESLMAVLRTVLTQTGERKRRGRNAQEYAQNHYSWGAIANQTLDIYRRILARRGDR